MYDQIAFFPAALKARLEKYGSKMSKYLLPFLGGMLLCMTASGADALAGTGRDSEDMSPSQNGSGFRDSGDSIFIGQDPVTGDRIIRASPRQQPVYQQSPEIPYVLPEIALPQPRHEGPGSGAHHPYPYPPYQAPPSSYPANRPPYPGFSPARPYPPAHPAPQHGGGKPAYVHPGMRPHKGPVSLPGQAAPFVYQPAQKPSGPPSGSFPARPHRH